MYTDLSNYGSCDSIWLVLYSKITKYFWQYFQDLYDKLFLILLYSIRIYVVCFVKKLAGCTVIKYIIWGQDFIILEVCCGDLCPPTR